ncbi:hypothetical protein ACFQHO_41710 [Actinomadura yumaensis]|uniref:hypothetical protein n=1 Tax=Actinomadura yumaensis TaxID=111807 RepID=UPI0036185457
MLRTGRGGRSGGGAQRVREAAGAGLVVLVGGRQQLLEPLVDVLEDLHVLGHGRPAQLGEAGQGGVHARVAGRLGRRPAGPPLERGPLGRGPSRLGRRLRGLVGHHDYLHGAPDRGSRVASGSVRTLPSLHDIVVDRTGNGLTMANEDDCRAALDRIAERLAQVDADKLAEHVVERTISARIPDAGLAYRTRIHAGASTRSSRPTTRRAPRSASPWAATTWSRWPATS